MQLNLQGKLATISPAIAPKTSVTANLVSFSDFKDKKVVIATVEFCDLSTKQVILWAGNAYDEAGQYTDQDVQDRTVEAITTENFNPDI